MFKNCKCIRKNDNRYLIYKISYEEKKIIW